MSHTRRFAHRALTVIIFIIFCMVGVASSGADPIAAPIVALAPQVPDQIVISSELRPQVNAMLQMSPTFRQQFARIVDAAPKLILTARVDPTFSTLRFRARSRIRRYDSGLLLVAVTIGPGPSTEEWIAHEFEHVLEQLEGVPLLTLAAQARNGTWFSDAETIETSRATRAGRVVRGEMRGVRNRSDKFVDQ